MHMCLTCAMSSNLCACWVVATGTWCSSTSDTLPVEELLLGFVHAPGPGMLQAAALSQALWRCCVYDPHRSSAAAVAPRCLFAAVASTLFPHRRPPMHRLQCTLAQQCLEGCCMLVEVFADVTAASAVCTVRCQAGVSMQLIGALE
jgi:hypothetical protein